MDVIQACVDAEFAWVRKMEENGQLARPRFILYDAANRFLLHQTRSPGRFCNDRLRCPRTRWLPCRIGIWDKSSHLHLSLALDICAHSRGSVRTHSHIDHNRPATHLTVLDVLLLGKRIINQQGVTEFNPAYATKKEQASRVTMMRRC